MRLFKIFKFKGLYQNGAKMDNVPGYFRRFTNSWKDKTGRIRPFSTSSIGSSTPTNLPVAVDWHYPVATTVFKNRLFQVWLSRIVDSGSPVIAMRYADEGNTPTDIMQAYSDFVTSADRLPQVGLYGTRFNSENFGTAVVGNKVFLNMCVDQNKYLTTQETNPDFKEARLLTFDGLRVRAAGLPTPWTGIAGGSGSHYVRTVYATIGMDGEAVFSPYLQQRAAAATPTINLGQYTTLTSFSATRRTDAITGSSDIVPSARSLNDSLFNSDRYYDTRFVEIGIGGIAESGGYPSMTRGASSSGLQAGDWLMLHVPLTTLFTGLNGNLLMFKIRTVGASGGTMDFDTAFKFLNVDNVTWQEANFATFWAGLDAGAKLQFQTLTESALALSNIFQIMSYSTSPTAGFRVGAVLPCCHFSTKTVTGVDLSIPLSIPFPFMGQVTSFFSDWYDTQEGKTNFPPMLGITSYKEQLVGHDYNAIYFSDFSLGGSSEIANGFTNLAPFGTDHGRITAICGSEDFLLICRERKNYVLRGDIAGNFSLTECDQAIEGAINSRACANAWGGKVVFMNRNGIYSVDATGTIQEISEPIRDLFIGTNIDSNLFDKSIFKTATQMKTAQVIGNISIPAHDGATFKISLDPVRGFIFFLTASRNRQDNTSTFTSSNSLITSPNLLVFDTNDGSWYEWDMVLDMSAEALNGRLYSFFETVKQEILSGNFLRKQLLATQYFSLEEPSLEKQVTQLKLYGEFLAGTNGIRGVRVMQQNDWAKFSAAKVTDTLYTTTNSDLYHHKKRLNSSKAMSTSIILESTDNGAILLEGMEIEGTELQQGVKK
jgi:hypothetical protein